MNKQILFIFILFISSFFNVSAIAGDSLRISILTVHPRPNAVYTIYGHTAIRVCSPSENIDRVFNYGMFDFDKPNFIMNFVGGKTDYMLVANDFHHFIYAYSAENSTVEEQVLNLDPSDKRKIVEKLMIKSRPENREYRYNYFFDNCVTRPRDLIEENCGGTLIYPEQQRETTFRKLVHQCTNPFPWMTFGIDLIIGNGADSLIGLRNEFFLPLEFMKGMNSSYVLTEKGEKIPLILSSEFLIHSDPGLNLPAKTGISPLNTGILILLFFLSLAVYGYFSGKKFRFFFGVLYLSAFLTGILVAYLAFISLHPCTWPNWNLIWLHPLYVIPFVGCFFNKTYPFLRYFHWGNFVLLSLFLLLWGIIPQEINIASVPFIVCLGIGSVFYLIKPRKKKI